MKAKIIKSTYEAERGKPAPSKNHAIAQSNLCGLLMFGFREKYRFLSEVNISINEKVKVPDLAIYPKLNYEADKDIEVMSQLPLGVIEITTVNQPLSDLTDNIKTYFAKGVKSYWLVIPILEIVYIFSSTDDFEVFTKKDFLKDRVLDIKLEVSHIFK